MNQNLDHELVRYELVQNVAKISLNRPEVLNSFNSAMSQELILTLKDAAQNRSVRSILITGEGRAFCAGQDLQEILGSERPLDDIVTKNYNPAISLIRETEKPVVAAVNGIAAGAGANLALACDFVIASKEANFIQAFAKVGLIPDSGGTFFLPRLIGMARASALTMLGDKITAEDAFQMGLIYKVVDSASLSEISFAIARQLATQATKALGMTKRLLNASFANSLQEQLELEAALQGEAGNSEDYKEGISAFLEKRRAIFKGK
jgi:2-(1,2-epoxy-1,2-dihydrophenyl)acetyl-CoA isomerase